MGKIIKVKIPGKVENISRTVGKLLSSARELDFFDDECLFSLEMCARELLANAVEHGCCSNSEGSIWIELKRDGKKLIFSVEDNGRGFDWEEVDLEMTEDTVERGRGLALVAALAESITFNDKGNKVTVVIKDGG